MLGIESCAQLLCWISRYVDGEFINEHVDKAGDLQMILCLQAPPREHGGELRLEHGTERARFTLAPGDAVFFSATTVRHSTTPLRRSGSVPDPIRAVAVARFTWNS